MAGNHFDGFENIGWFQPAHDESTFIHALRPFMCLTDKYSWIGLGSSYRPGELIAAFLWAQLEEAGAITSARMRSWLYYNAVFEGLEAEGSYRRPIIPKERSHNAHMFYLLFPDLETRAAVLQDLRSQGIEGLLHYVPLQDSPGGIRYGRAQSELIWARNLSERLVRLPLWPGLRETVIQSIHEIVGSTLRKFIKV